MPREMKTYVTDIGFSSWPTKLSIPVTATQKIGLLTHRKSLSS